MCMIRNRTSSSSLLLFLNLKLKMGELEVTSHVPVGLQLTYDLVFNPEVGYSRLDQSQSGFSEGTPQFGPSVLKPDLTKTKK